MTVLLIVGLLFFTSSACEGTHCPADQKYVKCLDNYCHPITCDDIGYSIDCKDPDDPPTCPCEGGCVCKDNKVKNSKGKCVNSNNCPSCGGDYNATGGCGLYCGNMCSNYHHPGPIKCPRICYPNACDCKKGYVYDNILEQCIDPDDCPIPCNGDPYAVPTKCINNNRPTCANPGNKPSEDCCKTGCKCIDGYVLNKPHGKCIKISHCPDNLGCNGDPNAVITDCGSHCPPTCEHSIKKVCPAVCVPNSCKCKDGYILSTTLGRCIPKCQCVKGKYTPCDCHPPQQRVGARAAAVAVARA